MNMDIDPGHDYEFHVGNFSTCCDRCQKAPKCAAFVFYIVEESKLNCWLKEKSGPLINKIGVHTVIVQPLSSLRGKSKILIVK